MGYFDYEGEHLLYEIRLLTAQQRADVAEYVVDNRLGPAECNTLARAVKEYERRRSEREGFSAAPGDVMAFKYYRDAAECRREEDKRRCIDRGLDVAVSEGARRRLVRDCFFFLFLGFIMPGVHTRHTPLRSMSWQRTRALQQRLTVLGCALPCCD